MHTYVKAVATVAVPSAAPTLCPEPLRRSSFTAMHFRESRPTEDDARFLATAAAGQLPAKIERRGYLNGDKATLEAVHVHAMTFHREPPGCSGHIVREQHWQTVDGETFTHADSWDAYGPNLRAEVERKYGGILAQQAAATEGA